jgi:hypothetical protein
MKNLLLLVLASALLSCADVVKEGSISAIPSLRIEGSCGELLVDDKPYIMYQAIQIRAINVARVLFPYPP